MTRDTQSKISKKFSSTKKKEESARLKKKKDESSDSDFNSDDEFDEEDMDIQEYREFLAKTFPSKHMDKKVKAGKKLKQVISEEDDDEVEEKVVTHKSKKTKRNTRHVEENDSEEEDDDDDDEYIPKNSHKKISNKKTNKNNNKKSKTKYVEEDEETESSEDDEDTDESEEDDEPEVKGKSGKFNIIFTIGSGNNEYEDDDFEDDDDEEWLTCSDENETENEDDPVSTDEDTEEEDEDDEEEDKPVLTKKPNKKIETKKQIEPKKQVVDNESKKTDETVKSTETKNLEKENILTILKDLQGKNKDDELITECIKVCEEKLKTNKKKLEKKLKKQKERNDRIFKRILRDKNTMNDFEFFEKLEVDQQKKIIKELREINKITRVEKPYRLTLLESNIPIIFKSAALKKISTLRYMETGSGEFYKIKNWVDTFMRIPFGNYNNLPISIDDGVEKCHEFMSVAQKTLDDAVYGLNDAKMQIMQLLGQLVTNPKAIGTAIAIHGPPGTGKTSLVKEGISKILNRPFAFIALGGATDSSFLEGHGYTYEGSTWGKIVQILIDSKCMNPVIYFDELDKISETPKGEEIAGILTHLTDTSQNTQFHDKYFSEIDFDLSKCLFIFSYNDESKVNPILKDRMYRIQTKGYNQKQKTVISNNYLLPKIREQVRFNTEDIIIPDETIHYIIDNFCNKEDGVRNLKRCLEIIYTKLNLYRLMRPGSNLFEEDMALKVEFPFKVTKDIVDKLIKNNKENISALHNLYV
jgi:ATP-dependent Lon protease